MMDLSFLATALVHAGTLKGAEEAVSRANLALRSARATLRHAGENLEARAAQSAAD